MADTVLMVFEGAKTEREIFKNLAGHYFSAATPPIIRTTFGTDIYQLWREVQADGDLDLLEIIRGAQCR